MNFFKNPNFDSIKILAGLLIVAGAGYFLFSSSGERGLDSSGKVLKGDKKDFAVNDGSNFKEKYLVKVTTTFDGQGGCKVIFTYSDGTQSTYNGTPEGLFPEDGCDIGGVVYGEDGEIIENGPKVNFSVDESGSVSVSSPSAILTNQIKLWMQGFLPQTAVTGELNTETTNAIKGLQASKGLTASGTLDSGTVNAISEGTANISGNIDN